MDEQKLKEKLNPEQYRIMREGGMEMPFISKYWNHDEHGVYVCAACGHKLFSSLAKFDAGEGWPTFKNSISEQDIEIKNDKEVLCRKCQSHLGELVLGDKKYFRINSVCLEFKTLDIEIEDDGEGEEKESDKEKTNKERSGTEKGVEFLKKGTALLAGGLVVGLASGLGYCHFSSSLTGSIGPKEETPVAEVVSVLPTTTPIVQPAAVKNPPISKPASSAASVATKTTAVSPTAPVSEPRAVPPALPKEVATTSDTTTPTEEPALSGGGDAGTAPASDGTLQ